MYCFSYFRDIKAGNILLNAEGHAKLADFGVAGQLTVSVPKITSICIFTWREHLSEVWAFLGHLIYPWINDTILSKIKATLWPTLLRFQRLSLFAIASLYIFSWKEDLMWNFNFWRSWLMLSLEKFLLVIYPSILNVHWLLSFFFYFFP